MTTALKPPPAHSGRAASEPHEPIRKSHIHRILADDGREHTRRRADHVALRHSGPADLAVDGGRDVGVAKNDLRCLYLRLRGLDLGFEASLVSDRRIIVGLQSGRAAQQARARSVVSRAFSNVACNCARAACRAARSASNGPFSSSWSLSPLLTSLPTCSWAPNATRRRCSRGATAKALRSTARGRAASGPGSNLWATSLCSDRRGRIAAHRWSR